MSPGYVIGKDAGDVHTLAEGLGVEWGEAIPALAGLANAGSEAVARKVAGVDVRGLTLAPRRLDCWLAVPTAWGLMARGWLEADTKSGPTHTLNASAANIMRVSTNQGVTAAGARPFFFALGDFAGAGPADSENEARTLSGENGGCLKAGPEDRSGGIGPALSRSVLSSSDS
jgi:hypothetical protein